MELPYQIKDHVIVVTVDIENLDARIISEFKDRILDILTSNDKENIIFDLHKLRFIDSSGLGAFLSILRLLTTRVDI